MKNKRIDIALAKKIIEHNPHLSDFDKALLIDNGQMIKERISKVLENTPNLTLEQIQLIEQNGLRVSKRDGKRRERFQGSEETRAKLVQQFMKKQENDPNYRKYLDSKGKIQAQRNTSEESNTDDL